MLRYRSKGFSHYLPTCKNDDIMQYSSLCTDTDTQKRGRVSSNTPMFPQGQAYAHGQLLQSHPHALACLPVGPHEAEDLSHLLSVQHAGLHRLHHMAGHKVGSQLQDGGTDGKSPSSKKPFGSKTYPSCITKLWPLLHISDTQGWRRR